ncbi:MAG: cyanophycin synthetase [Steroidobacteraceae bacterium]
MGCWTPREGFDARHDGAGAAGTLAGALRRRGAGFDALLEDGRGSARCAGTLGDHNVDNALAAIAAARHAGVPVGVACAALESPRGVRRLQRSCAAKPKGAVYDDFAHHPTAIETTIAGLRRKVGSARILAVLEPRSNTMQALACIATRWRRRWPPPTQPGCTPR